MKTKSIYPAINSLQLKEVLDKYSPKELLYAPIDVAKYNHRSLGYGVAVINPFDSWKERLNKSSKTDKIDLGSIAKSLISRKFSSSTVPIGIYYNLQRATRTRRKFVNRRTSSKNIITGLLDILFPGLMSIRMIQSSPINGVRPLLLFGSRLFYLFWVRRDIDIFSGDNQNPERQVVNTLLVLMKCIR